MLDPSLPMRRMLWLALLFGWSLSSGVRGQALDPASFALIEGYLQTHARYLQGCWAALDRLEEGLWQGDEALGLTIAMEPALRQAYQAQTDQVEAWLAEESHRRWAELYPSLQTYHGLAREWDQTLSLLTSHVRKGYHRRDEGAYAYAALRRMALMLADAAVVQAEIDFWLTQRLPPQVEATGWGRAVQALRPLLATSQAMLIALKQGQATAFHVHQSHLTGHMMRLAQQQKDLLPRGKGHQKQVQQWAGILDQAVAWSLQVDSCLAGAADSANPKGRGYSCFNHELNPQFARMVGAYQALLAETQGHLPPPPIPLPWLRVRAREEPSLPTDTIPPGPPPSLAGAKEQNLIFLVDVSGSMQAPERLPLFQAALDQLIEQLRPEDYLGLVTFAGKAKVLLPPTSGRQKPSLHAAVRRLAGEGQTVIYAGFETGYRAAQARYRAGGSNRLLLVTDGEFDISEDLVREVEAQAYAGVQLSVLLLGKASPRMQYRMRRLAEVGGGQLVPLSSDRAAGPLLQYLRTEDH